MKIHLVPKTTVKGYSQLFGIDHLRIKARSKQIDTCSRGGIFDIVREKKGNFTKEYRLVKEPEGYIFRCVLGDSGINGHHKTMKKAIVSALNYVSIYVDEKFEYEHLPEFELRKSIHLARERNCKHQNNYFDKRYECQYCPTCDTAFRNERQ